MPDKFEDFFIDNKDDFDMHEPPEQVWRSVSKELQRRNSNLRRTYYAAAALVLLIVGSFAWFMSPAPHKSTSPVNGLAITPNVNDTETYYATLIDKQRAQLEQFSKTYPEVCKDFAGEIDTLHQLYGQLKVEYKNSNGNEAVLQAMIENLRTQVQLLNSQMQVILTIKQKENKQATKNS